MASSAFSSLPSTSYFQVRPGKLSPELWRELHGIPSIRALPRGTNPFQPGSEAAGVFLVESGEVRVLLPSGSRQKQLLHVAGPGTLLGLSETMTGSPHRVSAEAGEDASVSFIPRGDFLVFLREHCDFCMQVVRLLSEDLHGIYHKFRCITAHPGRPRQRALEEQLN